MPPVTSQYRSVDDDAKCVETLEGVWVIRVKVATFNVKLWNVMFYVGRVKSSFWNWIQFYLSSFLQTNSVFLNSNSSVQVDFSRHRNALGANPRHFLIAYPPTDTFKIKESIEQNMHNKCQIILWSFRCINFC